MSQNYLLFTNNNVYYKIIFETQEIGIDSFTKSYTQWVKREKDFTFKYFTIVYHDNNNGENFIIDTKRSWILLPMFNIPTIHLCTTRLHFKSYD